MTRSAADAGVDIAVSNQLWQADMTNIWCGEDGWGYFTAVIDTFDRVLLGWSFTSRRCRAVDVSPSLEMTWATAFPPQAGGTPTTWWRRLLL